MFTLKKNSLDIKYEDLGQWLAVCGYILPQTEGSMARFDKLYADYQPKYSINDLDFEKIWNDEEQFEQQNAARVVSLNFRQMKMAARGMNSMSDEIKQKIFNNQEKHG